MKTYKPLDKSWKKKANQYIGDHVSFGYLEGANDFRNRALEALEMFTVLTNDEVFLNNSKIYISQEDVIALIEGLYAEVKTTKKKTTKKKSK